MNSDGNFQDTSTDELLTVLTEAETSLAQIEQFLRKPSLQVEALIEILRFQPGLKQLRKLLVLVLHERAELN